MTESLISGEAREKMIARLKGLLKDGEKHKEYIDKEVCLSLVRTGWC
jgi:hypothetical protein